jgi:flagellar basal body-associated protein FliL
MKSCLGLLLVLLVMVAVLGTGGLIWYLSSNAEFTRKDAPEATAAPSATPLPPVKPAAPRPR